MQMDNLKIYSFSTSIESVGDTLKKVDCFKKEGEIIQLLNADSICSINHIIHGVNQAFLAFSRGENLANDMGVEILLRCSAQRQISKAFEMLGLREGEMNLFVVLLNSNDYFKDLSSIFSYNDQPHFADSSYFMELYDISCDETKHMSIEEIIIDRITKLTVDF